MAASRIASNSRLCFKYKYFFYVTLFILGVQLFLGYNFYSMNQKELDKLQQWRSGLPQQSAVLPTGSDKVSTLKKKRKRNLSRSHTHSFTYRIYELIVVAVCI